MYKTRLQELCHQKLWDLPEYFTRKEGQDHNPRFYATVSVNGRSFDTPSPSTSSKKAQNNAAKVAFDYFSSSSSSAPLHVSATDSNIDLCSGGTTQAQDANGMSQTQDTNGLPQVNVPTAVSKIDSTFAENLYKSLLQSYVRKKSLALPCYSCERIGPPHAMHFKCKVTVGGKTYESQELFTTLSKAQHAAAKVALMSLAPEGIEEDESAYKNLLQELAQKECYQLPAYSTTGSGEAHKPAFISTVEVGGETFSGLEARTKKHAEFSAAKVAYIALKQRNSKQSPLTSGSAISSAHPIDSSSANLRQNMSFDNPNQIAPSPSPPRQRQRISKSSSSSRQDFAAFLHENAQPELSGSDEEPLQDKEIVEASSEAQHNVVEIINDVCPVASPVEASCPSSGPAMLSLPVVGVLSSSSSSDSSTNSAVLASGEDEKGANIHKKVIVHPRSTNMSYPPGSTVLSVSDDNWVAVGISTGSRDAA